MRFCVQCNAELNASFRFCNQCGAPTDAAAAAEQEAKYYSRFQVERGASVRLLRGKGQEGEHFSVAGGKTVGRGEADLRFNDGTLSSVHARFEEQDGALSVKDLGSLNGVFLRISGTTTLKNNDIFRIGDHYFLFEWFDESLFKSEFQTQFFSTPRRGMKYRLVEILAGGLRGRALCAGERSIVIGRRDGDWIFSDDEYLSPRHCEIECSGDTVRIKDLGSRNGVFLRIRGEAELRNGDLLFVGDELFAVSI
ncbi:MAG: FHA domain-containing protein [Bradymonadales bacterium]|jgi:pSer/pThr/pTyr-binding forkhead associated (FHA) protein